MNSMAAASPILLKRRARWPIPVLLLLSIPVFYYNLGNYGLVNGDEGFYHKVAQNMVRSGDWLTIQWNGELRIYETFMNSPIQHWMRAALIYCFGYNYWTMRFISATCGLLAVIFTYKLARQFMVSAEAFLAAVLLMVSFQFVFLHGARTGELDALITFLFVFLAYSFVRALRENKSFILHHVALLALVNIKLPVIIMPLAFEVVYFAMTPKYWRHFGRWTLTLICMGPFFVLWHIYQLIDLKPSTVFSVLQLMAEQASGDEWQQTRHGPALGFWESLADNAGFYGRMLLFGGFPYVVFAPLALIGVWRHKASTRTMDYSKIIVLALLAVLGFYCAVSRRFPWYIIPAYPFLAILTARFLFRLDRLGRGHVVTALVGVAGAVALMLSFRPAANNPFARRAMSITPRPILNQSALLGELQPWLVIVLVAAGIYLAMLLIRRLTQRVPVCLVPLSMILIIVTYGGVRVGSALRYTHHVSSTERFAGNMAQKVARNRPLEFPISLPPETANNLAKYYFGEDYLVNTRVRPIKLTRPLLPEEKTTMRRADLVASLTPTGVAPRRSVGGRHRSDDERGSRYGDRRAGHDAHEQEKAERVPEYEMALEVEARSSKTRDSESW